MADTKHDPVSDPAISSQYSRLGCWDRMRLIWGGPRRWILKVLWPRYVARQHAIRRGECRSCGVCCRMSWHCRNLEQKNGQASCKIYNGKRMLVCNVFPINNMDLADRNRVDPSQPCGFYWE